MGLNAGPRHVMPLGLAAILVLQFASAPWALAGNVVHVRISNLAFTPANMSVRVGDVIEWQNDDIIDHTATSGEWDVMIPVGKTAQLQIVHAGALDYFCRFHPNMTGTIRISND